MKKLAQREAWSVAVSGLHRGDSPQPGASVISSLRRRFPNLHVVGLSYDPMESCLYSHRDDRVDEAYLFPYPRAGANALLQRIDEIHAKNKLDYIIPCLDSELPNFISIAPKLRERGIASILPTRQSFEQRGKDNLSTLCQHLGIPTPETFAANDPATLARFAEKIGYPVYVKGIYYEAHLVASEAALYNVFGELFRAWGGPVLVQEPVFGEEYDIVGLGDGKGNLVGHCAIRKMLRTAAGKGFAGIVIADPHLEAMVRRIIRTLRWDGPFELEFVKAAGREHALFEMNPRFPAWVDFPSQIGCNLPVSLFERLLGSPPSPLKPCEPGQMFIRHSIDLVGNIAELAKMASDGERAIASKEFEPEASTCKTPTNLQ
jgi:carbamoyl-phosphate synthase large subunit